MPQQFRIRRLVGTVPIVAGGVGTIDLPRQYDYESIQVRIVATLNVTAGATSVRAEAPTQLVQRMDLTADGKNLLFSAPFWYASLANYKRQLTNASSGVTVPPTAVSIAAYNVEATGVIDLMTPDGVRPKDSNFRTKDLSLFQLRFQFGQPGDSFVGGTVSFTGTPVVEVSTVELVELPVDAAGNLPLIPFVKKVSWQQFNVTATNANFEARLPAGNLIRSVMARTAGSVTAGEPSIAMLNAMRLVSGVDVRLNTTGPGLRRMNSADFGALTAGYYAADLLSRGYSPVNLSELWDVRGAAEPKAQFDIVGGANNILDVVTEEYIPAQ